MVSVSEDLMPAYFGALNRDIIFMVKKRHSETVFHSVMHRKNMKSSPPLANCIVMPGCPITDWWPALPSASPGLPRNSAHHGIGCGIPSSIGASAATTSMKSVFPASNEPQQVPNEIPQRVVASVDAPDVGWALLIKSITHSRRLSAVSSKTPQTPERLENELCYIKFTLHSRYLDDVNR